MQQFWDLTQDCCPPLGLSPNTTAAHCVGNCEACGVVEITLTQHFVKEQKLKAT